MQVYEILDLPCIVGDDLTLKELPKTRKKQLKAVAETKPTEGAVPPSTSNQVDDTPRPVFLQRLLAEQRDAEEKRNRTNASIVVNDDESRISTHSISSSSSIANAEENSTMATMVFGSVVPGIRRSALTALTVQSQQGESKSATNQPLGTMVLHDEEVDVTDDDNFATLASVPANVTTATPSTKSPSISPTNSSTSLLSGASPSTVAVSMDEKFVALVKKAQAFSSFVVKCGHLRMQTAHLKLWKQ
jgi:hypothetical protein